MADNPYNIPDPQVPPNATVVENVDRDMAFKGELGVKYPFNLGQPPVDKWMLFEVRSGRHIMRDGMAERNGVDRTIASAGLYIPESALKSAINVTWQQDDFGPFFGTLVETLGPALGGSMRVGAPVGETFKMLGNEVWNKGKALLTKDGKDGTELDLSAVQEMVMASVAQYLGGPLGNSLGVVLGAKPNPKTDMYFDAQQYREFQFDYMLIPRSQQEAESISKIIAMFQYYMLPSYETSAGMDRAELGSMMIGYPYEFEISFRDFNGAHIEHVGRIGRSVLTGINIDHAAGGKTAFYRKDGTHYPVATKLSVSFREVRLLGRDSKEIKRPGADYKDA
jgi:hypothetical protein